MRELRRILFPVDFSERCRGAARHAAFLAGRFHAQLLLLHVVETPVTRPGELDFGVLAFEADLQARTKRAADLIEAFSEPGFESLEIAREVASGDAARTIVRCATERSADLIMMPTHGYGVFRRFVLGSVTAKVLHDAHCPVWTGVHLERAAAATEPVSYARVLCAVDLSAASDRPLRAAVGFASVLGAELAAVHAVPGSEAVPDRFMDRELRMDLVQDARQRLAARLEQAGAPAATVIIEGGEPAKVIHAAALRHNAGVVFIGRGEHAGAGRLRTHSYAIIRESPCPVISV
ncbi:MAG TPA: universal stress protein [Bryobacteraceae bacterium]|nr:universal stress protein [Bryobacteraceae bacterium]